MEGIPQPTKSAKTVVAVTGAVCAALVPGFDVLRELHDIYLAKKIEQYREVLITEISHKGIAAIDDLSDEQIDFLIPGSYRFFEQVRLADYDHNLRILARFLANNLAEEAAARMPGDVGKFARQLEYLDQECLRVLAAAVALEGELDSTQDSQPFVSSKVIVEKFVDHFDNDMVPNIRTALAILSARGLMYPDSRAAWDKSEEHYFVSSTGRELKRYILHFETE